MNNKGQALVEFVMIIPIFLFLVLGMIDFGNILYQKYHLENDLDVIVELYKENKQPEIDNYLLLNNINLDYGQENEFKIIELSKRVVINTPGLNLILKEPYYEINKRYLYE